MTSDFTLRDRLAHIRASYTADQHALDARMIARLEAAGLKDRALKVGDQAPDFLLPTAAGHLLSSQEARQRSPLVIDFYRGAWCPFCTAELEALEAAHEAIRSAGARLVAVTGEVCGLASEAQARLALTYEVLVDVDGGLALAFGLLFPLPEDQQKAHLDEGIDVAAINGNGSWFLPVPATYVVDREGIVRFAHVDPDYRNRAEPCDIIRVLQEL